MIGAGAYAGVDSKRNGDFNVPVAMVGSLTGPVPGVLVRATTYNGVLFLRNRSTIAKLARGLPAAVPPHVSPILEETHQMLAAAAGNNRFTQPWADRAALGRVRANVMLLLQMLAESAPGAARHLR